LIKTLKLQGDNDPDIYLKCGKKKVDQIFNVHQVRDQEQADLIVV